MNGDNLRDVLPLLRPRSAEPTLFSQAVFYLLWVGVAVLLTMYLVRWLRHRRQREDEFQAVAHTAGLSAAQVALLFRIARKNRMKSPPPPIELCTGL